VRQGIEAVETAFQDAYNKHDAAAIAALHTPDAVEVRTWQGVFSGQQRIKEVFENDFVGSPGKMANKIVEIHQVDGFGCAIIDTTVGGNIGHVVRVYVPGGPTWKISMSYVSFR